MSIFILLRGVTVLKEKVGNLELEVKAIVDVDGNEYKVVDVPNADEYKGFPPSWEFVKSHMLNWRPYFKGKMVEFNGMLIPAVSNYLLNLDEEMYELVMAVYNTFKVNKPSIETNVSVVVTDQINELERKIGRRLSEEEKTSLYIRYAVELAILRDVGLLN
jgi:hypothetical protein